MPTVLDHQELTPTSRLHQVLLHKIRHFQHFTRQRQDKYQTSNYHGSQNMHGN